MPDFPVVPAVGKRGTLCTADITMSKVSMYNWLVNGTMATSTAWGTANLALYIPVFLGTYATVYQMGVTNGTVVNGNFQLGVYNERGVQMCVTASTAQAGVSAIQKIDVTDTLLTPGVYYLAIATNSTTATFNCAATTLIRQAATGVQEQTTAFTLPSPITLGTLSTRLFCPAVTAFYHGTV